MRHMTELTASQSKATNISHHLWFSCSRKERSNLLASQTVSVQLSVTLLGGICTFKSSAHCSLILSPPFPPLADQRPTTTGITNCDLRSHSYLYVLLFVTFIAMEDDESHRRSTHAESELALVTRLDTYDSIGCSEVYESFRLESWAATPLRIVLVLISSNMISFKIVW